MSARPSRRVIVGVVITIAVVVATFLWMKRSNASVWTDIGVGGPKKWTDFPYRLVDFDGLPPTHPDLVGLTLGLQSGRAKGAWVYLPIDQCYAPKGRDGAPSVRCESVKGSGVILAGADNVREVLLSLKSDGKLGAVQGEAIGLYADLPVIWVTDPKLKRSANH